MVFFVYGVEYVGLIVFVYVLFVGFVFGLDGMEIVRD